MSPPLDTPFGRIVSELPLDSVLAPDGIRSITGLIGPSRSLVQAAIAARSEGPVVVVVADERRLGTAISDLSSLCKLSGVASPVLPFPAFALDPYRGLSAHLNVTHARVLALSAIARGDAVIVVAPAAATLYRTAASALLLEAAFELAAGDVVDPMKLTRALVDNGYRHEDPVVTPGDFARRGGIIDVFPPGEAEPFRLELTGDELEEIRTFDPDTQRTTGVLERVRLPPASEWPARPSHIEALGFTDAPSAGMGFRLPKLDDFRSTLFDYVLPHGGGRVLIEEPADVARAAELEWERVLESAAEADDLSGYAEPSELLLGLDELLELIDSRAITLRELTVFGHESRHIGSSIAPSFSGRLDEFIVALKQQLAQGFRVHVFVSGEGMADRTVELLAEEGLSAGRATGDNANQGHVVLELSSLSQSFILPELSLSAFTATDIFAEAPPARARRGAKLRRFLSDFRDLAVGDYVVHTEHGIGVFTGLTELDPDGGREMVVLEYGGGDKLYVPVDKLDFLEKYSSSEAAKPRLDKLGGTGWARVKKRVRRSMRDMAQELLKLYAARKSAPGHGFAEDGPWMREFEALFEFDETPDQQQAIDSVKRDMETASPMDRLLVGDVGFGKTEVAMRAAFKAVNDGRQVAVLVPTTVLAFQHATTFRARFAAFPVRVEMLSRFRTKAEQKQVVADLAAGKVDIVIGTHRLLSKDIELPSLGLLIVDEEQRFGVTHKERLKTMRHGVDSLTLTATPIPRTLHMSLSGIRDLSMIETPPRDRMAIQTHITRLDPKVLTEAIRYELSRSGQVYFVHNRVSSIYSLASYLERLVPEARIIVGHGQMKETELEQVMLKFIRREFDILVSTTIIENGLDIPLVNTLFVNRADRFGLSQLYQLRGRVGRSNRRAYAYLLVPEEAHLTPIARRRLAAIREFSELGAGFRIAALDLELRGAGNLLGGEQHGHIDAVGFDLYCRLLDETVQELSGEGGAVTARTQLELRLELRIPEAFVADSTQRMSIYKRASAARDAETIDRLQDETRDRFGALPDQVRWFFELARLQIRASAAGVDKIERGKGKLSFRLTAQSSIGAHDLVKLAKDLPARIRPEGESAVVSVVLAQTTPASILSATSRVLRELLRYSKID